MFLELVKMMAILVVLGIAVELWRRRRVRRWASGEGGTFEPGTLLGGVTVPESEPFDASARKDYLIVYSNVARIIRPEATYVVARSSRSQRTSKHQRSTASTVCFVTPREGTRPDAIVALAASGDPGASVQARGGVVRLESWRKQVRGEHQMLFEAARRWVAEATRSVDTRTAP
jgi:hypothetical protein